MRLEGELRIAANKESAKLEVMYRAANEISFLRWCCSVLKDYGDRPVTAEGGMTLGDAKRAYQEFGINVIHNGRCVADLIEIKKEQQHGDV